MSQRRTFTVLIRQSLMTALDIEAANAREAGRFAEELYYEPAAERIDLGTRKLLLADNQWLGNVAVHHVEEAYT